MRPPLLRMPCRPGARTIRFFLFALSVASPVAGCTWVPTIINQGVDAATTVAEHRSFYTTAADYSIRSEIRSKFMDEDLLLDISTDVYKGRVMLTGLVKNAVARNRAEELTRRVSAGEIFNEIQITDDAGIKASAQGLIAETKIKVKLLSAEGVRSINYRVRAINGVVYVLGTAVSPEELERVVSIAHETDGVHNVITHVMRQDVDDPLALTAGDTEFSPVPEGIKAQVLSIQDGDVLIVMVGHKREKVRLIGSEAPDLQRSPRGKQAREALSRLVRGKTIRLETDTAPRDHDKRLLAYVYAGDLFVNLEMIRKGQASVSKTRPSFKYADAYRKAQRQAQDAGRGIWSAKHLHEVTSDCHGTPKNSRRC